MNPGDPSPRIYSPGTRAGAGARGRRRGCAGVLRRAGRGPAAEDFHVLRVCGVQSSSTVDGPGRVGSAGSGRPGLASWDGPAGTVRIPGLERLGFCHGFLGDARAARMGICGPN